MEHFASCRAMYTLYLEERQCMVGCQGREGHEGQHFFNVEWTDYGNDE